MPTPETKVIGGKRRAAVGYNRFIRLGDVTVVGQFATTAVGHHQTNKWKQFYRLLPARAKREKDKPKSFVAYGRTAHVGKFIRFEMTLDLCEDKAHSAYRITPITLRKARK